MDAEYVALDSVVPDIEEDHDLHGPTLDQRFYDKLAAALAEHVKQCGPRVPVVTGMSISHLKIYILIYLVFRFLRPGAWVTTPASRERLYRSLCSSVGCRARSVRTANMERS